MFEGKLVSWRKVRDAVKSPTHRYSSDVANSVVIMVSANRVIQKGQKEHMQG